MNSIVRIWNLFAGTEEVDLIPVFKWITERFVSGEGYDCEQGLTPVNN